MDSFFPIICNGIFCKFPIHSFSIPPFSNSGSGLLEPIKAAIGWEVGYTLDGSQVHHWANSETSKTNNHTHIISALLQTLESPVNITYVFLDIENPYMHRENMQTHHQTTVQSYSIHSIITILSLILILFHCLWSFSKYQTFPFRHTLPKPARSQETHLNVRTCR